jgi:hypothetical protein
MTAMIENWGEIVYAGARGEIVEPKFAAKYGCQIILKSDWNMTKFIAVGVPKEFEPLLKLRRGVKYGDQLYNAPLAGLEIIGSALGMGDTPEEACEQATTVAESIEAIELEYSKDSCSKLLEMIENGCKVLECEF